MVAEAFAELVAGSVATSEGLKVVGVLEPADLVVAEVTVVVVVVQAGAGIPALVVLLVADNLVATVVRAG